MSFFTNYSLFAKAKNIQKIKLILLESMKLIAATDTQQLVGGSHAMVFVIEKRKKERMKYSRTPCVMMRRFHPNKINLLVNQISELNELFTLSQNVQFVAMDQRPESRETKLLFYHECVVLVTLA